MYVACWSVKGGSGTSVTSALAARRWAASSDAGALLVDLCGDAAGLLGVPEPATPGVADWLNVGDEVQIDALRRLEREVATGLSLLHRGDGPLCRTDRAEVMARELAADHRVAVVDGGCLWRAGGEEAGGTAAGAPPDDIDVRRRIVAGADRSWLVTRACFLALRRAARAPLQPTGVVLLNEAGRPLTGGDVEDVVGAPVVLALDVDPSVARAVDAGLLASRVPAALDRALARVGPVLSGSRAGAAAGPRPTPGDAKTPTGADGERFGTIERDLHGLVVEACLAGEPVGLEQISEMVRQRAPLLSPGVQASLAQRVEARLAGLGPLEALVGVEAVSDVMVNGPGAVWVEESGTLRRTAVTVGESTLGQLIERVVAPLGLRADRTSPLVDARLPDGSRVNVVMPPVAVDGPYLIIRRFRASVLQLDDFASPPVAALLRWMVSARANIVVSGGTGAGKTTLLNTMAAHIPADQRIVTVEDAAELDLQAAHVVRLEARPRSIEGLAAVTVRDLVRNALRMRPDRILVGEVRGAEAFDMLQAMNTGHDGCLSTCHANGPPDALARLEAMVLMAGAGLPLEAVRDQINAAVDFIVHLARGPAGGRRVVGVAEVRGGPDRLVTLADATALRALPEAAPRAFDASPADPAWFDLQEGDGS